MKIHSTFVDVIRNEMELTEKEQELIEAIRNLKNSKHNFSIELELWTRELFENLLDKDNSD